MLEVASNAKWATVREDQSARNPSSSDHIDLQLFVRG
jgi:hypothetical protein